MESQSTGASGHRRLVLIGDAFLLLFAMLVAFGAHSAIRPIFPVLKAPSRLSDYLTVTLLVLPVWLVLVSVFGLDRMHDRAWSRGKLLFALAKLHAVTFVALAVLLFLTQLVVNRTIVVVFFTTTAALMYAERSFLAWRRRFGHARGEGQRRILLVGAPSRMRPFVIESLATDFPPFFVGYLRDGDPKSHSMPPPAPVPLPIELRGTVDKLEHVLHETAVDDVLFFPPHEDPDVVEQALDVCQRVGVRASFSIDLKPRAQATPRIVRLAQGAFMTFELAPKSPELLSLKYGIDFLGALVALALLFPVLLAGCALVAVTMGRPLFFVQERAGLNGRRFRLLKLRTMVLDAEERKDDVRALNELSGPVFKAESDPRITRIGKWLRKTSVDELPQLLNVLEGSMSLVGPRPLPVDEQQRIRGWHRRRLSMKPGITGLWQVSGRSNIDFEEWMHLDLRYVDEWSLALDAKLLALTLPAVVSGRGAR
jgi:exopolysaccharide biosynthesis polyprenyl glycosylphosphotransferase